MVSYEGMRRILGEHQQLHVMEHWDNLSGDQRDGLLGQLDRIDYSKLARMRRLLAESNAGKSAGDIEPAQVVRRSEIPSNEAGDQGSDAIGAGKVGVILVAGGQGTRLGFDGPKGAFPVGPVSGATLFEIHSRKILAVGRKHGRPLPFYIMTSEVNDCATRDFFESNGYFGLESGQVIFFKQGMCPALWPDGRMVMDSPCHVSMSPDGHGGIIRALRVNGLIDDMRRRGLTCLFYFQVDNPLVDICDPVFIGMHLSRGSDMSLKVCRKRDLNEGLGVVAVRDSRGCVVEYTELTDAQKTETAPNGELKFLFGSVAIHAFALDFIDRMSKTDLPLHIARKKVPYWEAGMGPVEPKEPNARKFEEFVFDVLPYARNALNMEFLREDEFSPVKNAEGADSPRTARRDMTRKYARWLESLGVQVPRNDTGDPAHGIEIDPCYALGPDDLAGKVRMDLKLDCDVLLK